MYDVNGSAELVKQYIEDNKCGVLQAVCMVCTIDVVITILWHISFLINIYRLHSTRVLYSLSILLLVLISFGMATSKAIKLLKVIEIVKESMGTHDKKSN